MKSSIAIITISGGVGRVRSCARASRSASSAGSGRSIAAETTPNRIAIAATLMRLRRSRSAPERRSNLALSTASSPSDEPKARRILSARDLSDAIIKRAIRGETQASP
ncbi:hypothetical protein [Erythrobacter donghaensis]|uniref:hypothetical protein n=1 Tax=Erythrobacter donghaensis TaxID=267135 RepID=UPI001E30B1E1|nr:hypothetical protein [Erythrobacter donghaensis]